MLTKRSGGFDGFLPVWKKHTNGMFFLITMMSLCLDSCSSFYTYVGEEKYTPKESFDNAASNSYIFPPPDNARFIGTKESNWMILVRITFFLFREFWRQNNRCFGRRGECDWGGF